MPGLGAAASTSGAVLQAESACEPAQTIIDVAATAEAFAVTALGHALDNANNGKLKLSKEQIQTLTAARAEEQAHYDYLTGAGAKAQTLDFTVPSDAIVTDPTTFLTTLIALEEAFVAAYLAAAQELSILGEGKLAQVALQIGAVEAEHRAGLRLYAIQAGAESGTPNDVAFEKALSTSVGEAADALKKLGFIGGTGTKITYPGPGKIDDTNVTRTTPGGPAVSCAVSGAATPIAVERSGTPEASPMATPMA